MKFKVKQATFMRGEGGIYGNKVAGDEVESKENLAKVYPRFFDEIVVKEAPKPEPKKEEVLDEPEAVVTEGAVEIEEVKVKQPRNRGRNKKSTAEKAEG